ncbi:hypothetical protein HYH03_001210 [Edaphochlamys debaryana]|uniref:Uncharacterized protein n=1 Tax=Edaphochlamys debaryana TaxID=47281 RepID=A0A835YGN1_9CHLO|nr:hypothetical protein HYH03_001210 [Edaphochlamys debaryana]|eukprot:KAG2501427.1 hypothetical protein HYH03_001210 [Edaphochlamys debaryana]
MGVPLPPGTTRAAAAALLEQALPPAVRHLAVLYGALGYDGPLPPTAAAARQLLRERSQALPQPHPLDADLAPVALAQVYELTNRLGYIGRSPFSFAAAQLTAACLRTILTDVEDEARLRPLPGMDSRQADLIQYLRSRRAPPGTRGMPAVQDLDLGARGGVNRLQAARHILQLLQNHELSAAPAPGSEPLRRLRALGLAGPVPPNVGECLMLAQELTDRCLTPSPAMRAALEAAGYPPPSTAPQPESTAHAKAVLRVLRRSDVEAATPATRHGIKALADLRRRPLAAPHAAVAAAVAGAPSGAGAAGLALGPCPSHLEVQVAASDQPMSEAIMTRLIDLGWSGPMPATHGAAVALEDLLVQSRTAAAALMAAAAAANANGQRPNIVASVPPPSSGPPSSSSSSSHHHAHPHEQNGAPSASSSSGSSSTITTGRTSVPPYRHSGNGVSMPGASQHSPYYNQYDSRASMQQGPVQHMISRLGSSPEEALVKIQIRGMFPGAVSEWYLPSMCREEAEHLLACLVAARRAVLEQVRHGEGYDAAVERWGSAEAEGDWWGSEWLWH